MRFRILALFGCLTGVCLFTSSAIFGASVTTTAQTDTCTATGTMSVSCSSQYSYASAKAGYEFIELGAFAVPPVFPDSGPSGAFASANVSDLLTFTDGSLASPAFVEFVFGVQSIAEDCRFAQLGASVANQSVPLSGNGDITTFTTAPAGITLGTPFSFGMSGNVLCGGSGGESAGQSVLNLYLEDIIVLSQNETPILGISLTSASGTAYPLDARNITPEPATLLLMGTGVLSVFAAARKRLFAGN
jgi:hypothetical protein